MGYIKTYRLSRNIFDKSDTAERYVDTGLAEIDKWKYTAGSTGVVARISCKANTQYTLYSSVPSSSVWRISCIETDDIPDADNPNVNVISITKSIPSNYTTTFTTSANAKYILFQPGVAVATNVFNVLQVVEGPLPPISNEPYNTLGWYDFIEVKTADGWKNGSSEKSPFNAKKGNSYAELV